MLPDKTAVPDVDDIEDNPDEEEEQFAIPAALLEAAGIESDEDWDALPEAVPNVDPMARLKRVKG